MNQSLRALGFGCMIMALVGASGHIRPALAEAAQFDPSIRPEFSEPVTLASKDGVLEVRLIVKQGQARLDTVAVPVKNFLVFAYEVIRGTASNGQMSGDNLYPAPTLQVFPGETLIVHVDNAMTGLTIRDFFDPHIYGEGRGGAALSDADDLVAASTCTFTAFMSVPRATPTM